MLHWFCSGIKPQPRGTYCGLKNMKKADLRRAAMTCRTKQRSRDFQRLRQVLQAEANE